ncbi:hypothetical protein [Bacillus sp. B-jedd]|uniref:hypothetical protein n=1 Tax=Bacillus sp. B-jedd TaxID=1476857 RepID=UPI0005155FC8|nr:hypothetical protein [Bacillus sp. B-jedd]CEG29600.1 hypothetical protein BN1002_04558 [Bacillus sp. B-jedd]
MKKVLDRRIAFYTRKVADYGSIHPSKVRPARHKHRHSRLMCYKALLFNQIEEAGYRK